jgi:cellulose synthase operon protein B
MKHPFSRLSSSLSTPLSVYLRCLLQVCTQGKTLTAAIALVLLLVPYSSLAAMALSQKVSVKQLGSEAAIYLPTIHAQREFGFTRPRDWTVQSAVAEVTLQHSQQLIDGSWLQVIVNDKVLTHVPLTKANTNGTKLKVPVPASLLKDLNRISYRVEQHYSKKCEDPVDPSLWTTLLDDSGLVFNYTAKTPKLSFQQFPYPVVDNLAYKPVALRYVLPQAPTGEALEAAALLNVVFAQERRAEALVTHVQLGNEAIPKTATPEQVIMVGTPATLGAAGAGFLRQLKLDGFKLQGDVWQEANGTPLRDNDALVGLAPNPLHAGQVVLVVTGNTPQAVLNGARFLAQRPKQQTLDGSTMIVPSNWAPAGGGVMEAASYIEKESRSLAELGFGVQSVEKITAPPLSFNIPVVTDFMSSGANLVLDLNYSYGPLLNPKYSSLELRLNDRSLANVPLTNEAGQERANTQITIPRDLLKTGNNFVAQFHLMPDKYGFCVDKYDDKAWAKIHEDSRLLVQGNPTSKLPDVSLLSLGRGYPYTLKTDLSETQILLGGTSKAQLEALMAVTSRLGRFASGKASPALEVGLLGAGGAAPDFGKHLVLIDEGEQVPSNIESALQLAFNKVGAAANINFKGPVTTVSVSQAAKPNAALLEMGMTNGNRVVTRFSGSSPEALNTLAALLENDTAFESLQSGKISRVANMDLNVSVDERAVQATSSEQGAVKASNAGSDWFAGIWSQPWLRWTLIALASLFALFFVLPFLVSLLFGKGRR